MSEHLALHPLGWRQASHGHSEYLQGPGAQLLVFNYLQLPWILPSWFPV